MRLHTDDKVLTSWNGLMVASLRRPTAYSVRSNILRLRCVQSSSLRTDWQARAGFLCATETGRRRELGCWTIMHFSAVRFWNCTGSHLTWNLKAVIWADVMEKYFLDEENGGFYLYADDAEELLIRPKRNVGWRLRRAIPRQLVC